MQPRAILEAVAAHYAELKTLVVEGTVVTESGDEESSTRRQDRFRAWYSGRDSVRIEEGGSVTVCSGSDVTNYHAGPKRYSKRPADEMTRSLGWFNPRYPGGSAFLFSRIAEGIATAEDLGRDADCHVIGVEYGTHSPVTFSPITFHIAADSHRVVRMEGETSHRMPAQDFVAKTRRTMHFDSWIENEPVAPEVFAFSPPADAIELPRTGGMVTGSGGGRGSTKNGCEMWHSTEWADRNHLVESLKMRFESIDLTLERRMTFSEDRRELRISERVDTPKGRTEGEFVTALKD